MSVEARLLTKPMTAVTPMELFEQYQVPDEFGLLSIDIEGYDGRVLKAIDFTRYRPHLVVAEMNGFRIREHLDEPNGIPIYMESKGYEMVGYSTMNAYFIRK